MRYNSNGFQKQAAKRAELLATPETDSQKLWARALRAENARRAARQEPLSRQPG